MKFQAVKGTRDFYPDQMRLRNWIVDTWRKVSLRNGFEEYDSPIFEYLDLFTAKSGQEIASQLFSLTDRGGRHLAVRPEITPALARMVNARINSLPRPIKWFSVPRLCRAENPQKGRLREFFQWNVDVIGEPSTLADAECVLVIVDFLRQAGLGADDVKVRYSSRELLAAVLANFNVTQDRATKVLAVLDKRSKVPADVFDKMLAELVAAPARTGILRFLDMDSIGDDPAAAIARNVGMESTREVVEATERLTQFERQLRQMGLSDWCRYDTGIIRGLAYYTGVVYEVFDAGQSLRAVGGGGRYDNLLEVLGGPAVPATGFGMGDVVLEILLREKGKLPELGRRLDFFVIDGDEGQLAGVLEVVARLREAGRSADFSYARRSVGKQLKEANKRGAALAVIVRQDGLAIKNMATGEQQQMPLARFLAEPPLPGRPVRLDGT